MPTKWWDTDSVGQFRRIANRFVVVIDRRDEYSRDQLLMRVQALLPALYSAGLELPSEPKKTSDDESDSGPADNLGATEQFIERWKPLYDGLGAKLADWNHYRLIYDPYDPPTEPEVTGCLADDLAGIYLDLLDGEELWAREEFAEAVWGWQFAFESHWGRHVTGALRAIHALAEESVGFPRPSSADV